MISEKKIKTIKELYNISLSMKRIQERDFKFIADSINKIIDLKKRFLNNPNEVNYEEIIKELDNQRENFKLFEMKKMLFYMEETRKNE